MIIKLIARALTMGKKPSPTLPTRKKIKPQAKWVDQQKIDAAKAKRARKMQSNKGLAKTETNISKDAP